MSTNLIVAISIDIVGIAVGLISIWMISKTKSQISGVVGKGLSIFNWAASFMILAFIYTIIFARLKLLPVPGGVDIHHLLMTFGMILFVIAARTFLKTTDTQ